MRSRWERALDEAAQGAGPREGRRRRARRRLDDQRGGLPPAAPRPRGARLAAPRLPRGGALPLGLHAALSAPATQATVPDLEFAHAVLVLDTELVDDMPILDLRIRKGVRRNGLKLAVATSRRRRSTRTPPRSRASPRGGRGVRRRARRRAGRRRGRRTGRAAGADADAVRALADLLRGAGEDIVIVYGERLTHGERGAHAARALLNVASRLNPHAARGRRPARGPRRRERARPARGRRAAGHRPGPHRTPTTGSTPPASPPRPAAGELPALYLLHIDPLRDLPDRATWEQALDRASTVIAHSAFLTEGVARVRRRRLPRRAARREGGHAHAPRRPPAAPAPGDRAPGRLARRVAGPRRARRRVGARPQALTAPHGLRPDHRRRAVLRGHHARRHRRQRRALARHRRPRRPGRPATRRRSPWRRPPPPPSPNGTLRARHVPQRVGRARGRGLARAAVPRAQQLVELSPADAERLGIGHGEPRRSSAACRASSRTCAPARPRAPSFLAGRASRPRRAAARSPDRAGGGHEAHDDRASPRSATTSPWWIQILKALVIFAVGLQIVPLVLLAERKLLGRFQHRYGPNRVGPFGALQPIADIGKLLCKEQFRPAHVRSACCSSSRPIISIVTARRDVRDHPVRRRRRHLRHAGRPLRHRRRHRHPLRLRVRRDRLLRPRCSAAGRPARSTRSSARCAPPRS